MRALYATLLLGPVLVVAAVACVRKDQGAAAEGVKRSAPIPTPTQPPGKPTAPPIQACVDSKNTFTTVDCWTVRYNAQWSSNVIVTLRDPKIASSIQFVHPTKALADKRVISEESCVPAQPDHTIIDKGYPVVAGVNLFDLAQQAAKPGSAPSQNDAYQYVFVETDRKYIAVARGEKGCSTENQKTPGNCYIWGVVEGNRVTTINNACIAGYDVHDREGGVIDKNVCGTDQRVKVQGQSYPAGFVVMHGDKLPDWQKRSPECKPPSTPRPPTDPTPLPTPTATPGVTVTPSVTPSPTPTPTFTPIPPKGIGPDPVVPSPWIKPGLPSKGQAPSTGATPVYAPPTPVCDVWTKGGCYDGWANKGAPPPEQQQPQPKPSPTIDKSIPPPSKTLPPPDKSIWHKK
jgi:hypothetical protein